MKNIVINDDAVKKPCTEKFVRRVYKLVPLSELEQDGYGPGGPNSGRPRPKYNEVLIDETYYRN